MAEFAGDSFNRIRLEYDEQYNVVIRKISKNDTIIRDLQLKQNIISTLNSSFPEYSEELDKITNELIIAERYTETLNSEKIYIIRKLKGLDSLQGITSSNYI